MEISLSELAGVKGIGKKTIQRIKEHKLADEGYTSEYDESLHLDRNSVNQGDCFQLMKGVADNSLDAVVTDPPYNLGFMGRSWDTIGTPKKFQKWNEKWAKIAYDKLKPGGYMIVFSGTKTYHRMASGVEDAGFEVKDMIEWMYGTGFPKSYNISKGFDKQAGAEREVIGKKERNGSAYMKEQEHWQKENGKAIDGRDSKKIEKRVEKMKNEGVSITKPATDKAKKWEGWGTALKPAHEPILLAQKPREGTYCENIDKWGVGGINIDECRVKTNEKIEKGSSGRCGSSTFIADENTEKDKQYQNKGRFPANLLLTHHPDCEYKGEKKVGSGERKQRENPANKGWCISDNSTDIPDAPNSYGKETVSDWDCHESCPVRRMNEQSGVLKSGDINGTYNNTLMDNNRGVRDGKPIKLNQKGDKGGAARYFNQFHFVDKDFFQYIPKASKSERTHDGKIENNHPTVKPVELMEWLIKLVVPEGGVMLDPFAGSGTTGVACQNTNRDYILIEKEQKYIDVIKERLGD